MKQDNRGRTKVAERHRMQQNTTGRERQQYNRREHITAHPGSTRYNAVIVEILGDEAAVAVVEMIRSGRIEVSVVVRRRRATGAILEGGAGRRGRPTAPGFVIARRGEYGQRGEQRLGRAKILIPPIALAAAVVGEIAGVENKTHAAGILALLHRRNHRCVVSVAGFARTVGAGIAVDVERKARRRFRQRHEGVPGRAIVADGDLIAILGVGFETRKGGGVEMARTTADELRSRGLDRRKRSAGTFRHLAGGRIRRRPTGLKPYLDAVGPIADLEIL